MCGIVGIWGGSTRAGDPARVQAMLQRMAHRGPDGQGRLVFPGGAAGMVRLALVDLSPRGQQPLYSPCGQVAILFNGEMYNFRAERERLRQAGTMFRTETDTEVALALYLEQGDSFVHSLRGMFALAIFDRRGRGADRPPRVLLARDPLGIKPLYVRDPIGAAPLVFASEVRALLASGLVSRELDRGALGDYLTYGFLPGPATLLAGVRLLGAGTLEIWDAATPPVRMQYWHMPPATPRARSLDAAAEELRAILAESVRLHAMADAPVGAFLSGGVDSTGVVGLMRPHVSALHTFTVRFPDVAGQDESAAAAANAARLDTIHHMVDVTGPEVAQILPRFAGELDLPSIDGLNTWLVSRAAREHVTGVLSGLGGDEWFAGYPVARRMQRLASRRGQAIARLGQLAALTLPVLGDGAVADRAARLAARRSALSLWQQTHALLGARAAAAITGRPQEDLAARLEQTHPGWQDETPLGLACLLDTHFYMGGQLLRDSDAASMAHSLELRVPLVDLELARFARTLLPEHVLPAHGGAKAVLVRALADVLPLDQGRRPKLGFALPFAAWLRGPVRPLVDDALSPDGLARRDWLDPQALSHSLGTPEHPRLYPQTWGLLVLELWARSVWDAPALTLADAAPAPAPPPPPGWLAPAA